LNACELFYSVFWPYSKPRNYSDHELWIQCDELADVWYKNLPTELAI
jgi:hypothetical protein